MPWIALSRNGNLASRCIPPSLEFGFTLHISNLLTSCILFSLKFVFPLNSTQFGIWFLFCSDQLGILVCNLVSIAFCPIWNFVSHWILPSLNFVSHWILPSLEFCFFLNSSQFKFGFPFAFCPLWNLVYHCILSSFEFGFQLNSLQFGIGLPVEFCQFSFPSILPILELNLQLNFPKFEIWFPVEIYLFWNLVSSWILQFLDWLAHNVPFSTSFGP